MPGSTTHPAYGEVPVVLKDATLSGKFNSFEFTLEHWHYDQFKTKGTGSSAVGVDGLQIMFLTNGKGDIDRLTIPLESSVAPILFTKKTPDEMKDPKFLSQFVGGRHARHEGGDDEGEPGEDDAGRRPPAPEGRQRPLRGGQVAES